jgi:tetratricopeptide (TPR) repeat protein
VDPPSQVVAGVRTVTTKMNGRCDPHVAAPIRFICTPRPADSLLNLHLQFDSETHFGVDTDCFMHTPSVILSGARHLLVIAAVLFLLVGVCSCRRGTKPNSNGNAAGLSSNPSDPDQSKRQAQSLVDQGRELSKNDQDEQAAEVLKQAIGQDPSNPEAHLRLGMAYAALGKKTDAEEYYKKAVDLYKKRIQSDQKDANAYFNLGEAHSFLHQDEEAARSYRQATRLKNDDEEAFYQLGMSETRLAHYPEAAAAFKKALELDPDDYRATDAIENAQEGANRIKEGKKHAEAMLKKQANANANGNSNTNSNSNAKPAPKRSPAKPATQN